MIMKFQLGAICATPGVLALVQDVAEVMPALTRHASGDWGDVDAEDAERNNAAIHDGTRILSAYALNDQKIWIITEADRDSTTILLPEEY